MLREIMRLVEHGVPYLEAVSMSSARRYALIVVCGELDGGVFDWDVQRWREP